MDPEEEDAPPAQQHQQEVANIERVGPPAGVALAIVAGNNNQQQQNVAADAEELAQPAAPAPAAARPPIGAAAAFQNGAAVNPLVPPVMPMVERNGQLVVDGRRVIDVTAGLRPGAGGQPFYNWQATKATLKERFQYLFNNELQADIHFIVGRGVSSQRIPAHRFVLSVGSAVFDAMFNSILATQSNEVDLPDVEPAAFLALLRFLYTDEVLIGPETVMTTLYTAKKYAVPALEAHCVEFLKKNLAPDNAFLLLTQARLFDEPQLATLCLDCIDQNTREALSADGFTDIDYSTLVSVLERDTLGGLREHLIFQAMERWADAECVRQELDSNRDNRRKVLGDAIALIRFPLMTVEEFALGPAQSGTLTERETVDLFLYFTLNPKPRVRFSDRPRCSLTGKEQCVNRFNDVAERWGYSGTSDRVRFSVDKKIYIVGFGLYGATMGPTDYQVNIQIIAFDSGQILGQNDTAFTCDGSKKTFRVMFKHPIEIRADHNYVACATLNGHESYYGTHGQRRVVKETSNGRTVFTFHYARGNNNGTSVEDGQLPEIIYYT